jgi:hypothetical protein
MTQPRDYFHRQLLRQPPKAQLRMPVDREERKKRDALMWRWMISVRGDPMITVETLADSIIPKRLIEAGYRIEKEAPGERILATARQEIFTRNIDGTLAPLVEGSTAATSVTVTHAGPTTTRRYRFRL